MPATTPASAPAAPEPTPTPTPTPTPVVASTDVAPAAVPQPSPVDLPVVQVADDVQPTLLPEIVAAGPALAPAGGGVAFHQPNQASRPAPASQAVVEPEQAVAPLSRKAQKKQMKLQVKQENLRQKQALKVAKNDTPSGGPSGLALLFTLLVLAALIAGAFVFGKPYLFPDAWDDESREYGEAIEDARGTEVAKPLTVQRRAADVYAVSMASHVVGPWQEDLPMWRSLGLSSGRVDAPFLGELVEGWTAAFYSPANNEVLANDAIEAAQLDAAISEAVAAGAIDQETGWSRSIDDTLLDSPALLRADIAVGVSSASAATDFGTTQITGEQVAVATYLPPIIEYRVTAPVAYTEFATDDPADFEALRRSTQLAASIAPTLPDGETLLESQRLTDRSFWYAVFASYANPTDAYVASNALVEASLATADNAGTACTYATFSGTDVAGTRSLTDVLRQWVAAVPAEMSAATVPLPDGTIQLRSCDPGVGFNSAPRFGVGREIARLRSVELAALEAMPVTVNEDGDRAGVIAEVRDSLIGLPMLDLTFDVDLVESAATARNLVSAAG